MGGDAETPLFYQDARVSRRLTGLMGINEENRIRSATACPRMPVQVPVVASYDASGHVVTIGQQVFVAFVVEEVVEPASRIRR